MYNSAYNIGYKYLGDTYGTTRARFTCTFSDKTRRARNKREYNDMVNAATDKDYDMFINPIPESSPLQDKTIDLLLHQINNSSMIAPKRELWEILVRMGLISASLDPIKN